jgi:hypothetical protein
MTKKTSEMTVREFLERAKKKGAFELLDDPNFGVLQILQKEGLTAEQAYEMKWKEAIKIYRLNFMDTIGHMFNEISKILGFGTIPEPYFTKINSILDEMEEELDKQDKDSS